MASFVNPSLRHILVPVVVIPVIENSQMQESVVLKVGFVVLLLASTSLLGAVDDGR